MIKHLTLTEDHLKLVRFLNIEDYDDDHLVINKKEMLTMRTHILSDVALILGLKDKAIKGTENDSDGEAYPDDVEKYMLETYKYVSENLFYIETLLHQMATVGLSPGEYICRDNELIWEKKMK